MVADSNTVQSQDGNSETVREIEWPLTGFTYATRTNVAQRKLNNLDACLMLIAANGPTVRTRTLKTLLRAWRPMGELSPRGPYWGKRELDFDYLFNSFYGHVSGNPEGRPARSFYHKPRTTQCFWWQSKRGEVSITVAGYRRLEQLKAELVSSWPCPPGFDISVLDNCISNSLEGS